MLRNVRTLATLALLGLLLGLLLGPLLAFASIARAQTPADELVVPPPPPDTASPAGSPPVTGPGAPSSGPSAELIVGPLVAAAEADLAAGRVALAQSRATIAIELIPEGLPLRIRAEGLRLLAIQRMPERAPRPSPDEVIVPLVAQAELDLRNGRADLAMPRLDLALARLPEGTPLRTRAMQLRASTGMVLGAPGAAAPAYGPGPSFPPPVMGPPPIPLGPPPRDPTERGTGEIVELYITAAIFGGITGVYIPYMATDATANGVTYVLTSVAGAGLLAVGVLTLDLTSSIRTGVAPTISAGIRLGLANGLLTYGVYESDASARGLTTDRTDTDFTLAWGGGAVGLAIGLGVGFGLNPSVRDARFVESVALWGGALGSYAAMMDRYDPVAGVAMTLVGLDVGLLAGLIATALDAHPSTGRTLFLDLGFLAGSALGAGLSLLGYYIDASAPDSIAVGVGMSIGSIAGWILMFALTDGWEVEPSAQEGPDVRVGLSPVQGGATVDVSGSF